MLRIIPLISSLLIRSFLHVRIRIVFIAVLILLQTVVMAQTWSTQNTSGMNYAWQSLAYGSSKFVAVGRPVPGQPDRVMTSPNGITWTGVEHNLGPVNFNDIVYANNMFVAVASLNQAGDNGVRVMTSPDGINWTGRSAPNADWQSVTYGNGIFVAVATVVNGGGATKVMTSANGINWTARNPSSTVNYWRGVTFGNGMFVAVSASSPTGHPSFMTSLDGINWTGRTPPGNAAAWAVTYGNGLFVSVAESGALMTSPDGINWTNRNSPANNIWHDVAYGNGRFIAVAATGKGNRVMASSDGINWNIESSPADNAWAGLAFANNTFVAVAETGTNNQAMRRTESSNMLPVSIMDFDGSFVNAYIRLRWKTSWEQNSRYFDIERSTDGSVYVKVGTVLAAGNSDRILSYEFLDKTPPQGTVHYRLRMTDLDTRLSYSNSISIKTGGNYTVTMGPNPTSGQASMVLPPSWTGRYDCRVVSMNGIVMYETKGLRAGSHRIDLSTFSPGLYRLMIWDNGECLYQQWIMRR